LARAYNRLSGAIVSKTLIEQDCHLSVQCALIVFELKNIMAAQIHDLLGDLLLTACRVDRYGLCNIKQFKQFGNGRDFIALGVGGITACRHCNIEIANE